MQPSISPEILWGANLLKRGITKAIFWKRCNVLLPKINKRSKKRYYDKFDIPFLDFEVNVIREHPCYAIKPCLNFNLVLAPETHYTQN